MSYGFHPAAEAEHLESVAFFESKRPGLGVSYVAEFERIMWTVCESPPRYPVEKQPDVRRIRSEAVPVCGSVSRSVGRCSSTGGCSQPASPSILTGQALTVVFVLFCIMHDTRLDRSLLMGDPLIWTAFVAHQVSWY